MAIELDCFTFIRPLQILLLPFSLAVCAQSRPSACCPAEFLTEEWLWGTSSPDLFPFSGHAPPVVRSPDSASLPPPPRLNYTLESSGPAQPIRNSCSLGCCCTACSQRGPESQFCRHGFLASNRSRETVCALGLEFLWVPTSEILVDFSIWSQRPDL